ncbi:MAG: MoxR family ATPase [Pseudomonadota bacterium]
MTPSDNVQPLDLSGDHDAVSAVLDALGTIILGKPDTLRLALTCILARGHLLIEDVPGMGKTTLAHALAKVLGLSFQRIQFTSDLLPADVVGVSMYDRENQQFNFHPGPLFQQLVLADEINRATPKTQSALLEAMEEQQVTVDGQTHPLPDPFFVIATQNPVEQVGTYPLPESQLDRFLMRLSVGYPSPDVERALLMGEDRQQMIRETAAVITPVRLTALQAAVDRVHVSEALVDYVQSLVQASRDDARLDGGLSPRAALGLIRAARAHAVVRGEQHVLPDDVQAVLPAVVDHRVLWRDLADRTTTSSTGRYLLEQVTVDP